MTDPQQQQQQPQHPGQMMAHQQQRPSYNTGEPDVLRNLIVNYIPTTIDENQLRQLFEMYGPTESVRIIINRETRQSRGFGFVKYAYAMSAVQALQCLNGYPLMNKRLKVAYAKEAEAQQANQEMSSNPMYAQSMMMMYQQQMQQQMMAQQYGRGGGAPPVGRGNGQMGRGGGAPPMQYYQGQPPQ